MSNKRTTTDEPQKRENYDPSEGDRPWPLYIWIFLMLMVSWATTYFALNVGDGQIAGGDKRVLKGEVSLKTSDVDSKVDPKELTLSMQLNEGKKVYQSVCQACHQATGLGLSGAFPPLADSNWVLGDATIPVRIVLHGLEGPIDVKGETYNGVMPAFQEQLDDLQISNVVTYIRNTWGNSVERIKPDKVSELRKSYAKRSKAWTAKELKE